MARLNYKEKQKTRFLCFVPDFHYLCKSYDNEPFCCEDIEDSSSAIVGRSDSLLDVSRLRFLPDWRCHAQRNGLDMDASFVALWLHGSDVQGNEVVTTARTYRRAEQTVGENPCRAVVVCVKSGDSEGGGICPMRYLENL